MKTKQFILLASITLFIIPSLTFASWWNPTDWFKKSIDITATTTSTSTPVVIPVEPIIQEKIVTKIVTVDNPELQQRIDQLEQENASLRQKINEDSVLLVQITEKHNEVLKKYNDMVYYLPSFTEAIGDLYKPYIDKLNECRALVGMMSVPTKVYVPTPAYSQLNTTIHCTSKTLFGTTYTDCR
jgi:hypothetical protein